MLIFPDIYSLQPHSRQFPIHMTKMVPFRDRNKKTHAHRYFVYYLDRGRVAASVLLWELYELYVEYLSS